ncbi:hypothetical protein BHE74_00000737 [Ensete ventricosum]|nr:hypothetical protein GW17_00032355 [Ensete ventricosum]RWW90117.1 hypothetical protein BHE74_00000737 [Ensete ventricosum]
MIPQEAVRPSLRLHGLVENQIDVIINGSAFGGHNTSGHRAYARAAIEKHPRQREEPEIVFREGEVEYPDHNNTLVVSVRIANAMVKRVMVDIGSSADVLYFDAFQKLSLIKKDLNPMASTLIGFIEDSIYPLGTTTLSITIRKEHRSKTVMVIVMVVGLPSAYNVILDRLTLNKLRVVISTCHQTMKFST